MDPGRKLISSRASARPILSAINRPLTAVSNATGLMPPKSSKDRKATSLRRQIQDKSFWMASLTAKMNEIQIEINNINRISDQLKNNESRTNLMQQAASNLAKELKEKSSLLSAYNEYFERMRFNENSNDVDKEIKIVIEDNEILTDELEKKFHEKKDKEKEFQLLENNFKIKQANWSSFLIKLNSEQQQRYRNLDDENKQLNYKLEQVEQNITQFKKRINQLEQKISESDKNSLFKIEVLHSLERLRQLKIQHEELFKNSKNEKNYENERSRLLAQVKFDNRSINQLEKDLINLENELKILKSQDEELTDENLKKYKNYSLEEQKIKSFLNEFDLDYNEKLEKIKAISFNINELIKKNSILINQISVLKDNENLDTNEENKEQLLLNEKRKLKLDLAKIKQLKEKVTNELESLNEQINKLNIDIHKYDDVQSLKNEAENKLKKLKDKNDILFNRYIELENEFNSKEKFFFRLKDEFEENDVNKKLKKLEKSLLEIEQSCESLYNQIEEFDYEHLRLKAFEEISKFNQKLLGF